MLAVEMLEENEIALRPYGDWRGEIRNLGWDKECMEERFWGEREREGKRID